MTPLRRCALLLPVLLAALWAPATAQAHEGDPRIVTTVDAVVPALPAEVVVQAQPGLAAQLVAQNPTTAVLEVLGTGGRPFLRISRAGVFADVASDDFFTTSNPDGAAPTRPGDAPPTWVRISTGDSWGWYDHRLHPDEVRAPADVTRAAELADWEVPLRYGVVPTVVRGTIAFAPLLGAFTVQARTAPEGVTVQALPGRLPGLFVSNPDRTPLTVLGRDGEPFVRFTERGVEVNVHSRTHVEDRAARGVVVGPPQPTPRFELVMPGGSSYTWLDARLKYPQDRPPARALRDADPTVVQQWTVPVEVAGAPATLVGDITWVPEASAAQAVRSAEADGPSRLPLVAGTGAVLVLLAVVLVLRRRH